jgi:KUP system potassium uptake protein
MTPPVTKSTHDSHAQSLLPLTLGALGIVFGDIGTSPLYAIQECVSPAHGVDPTAAANLFGLVSLIFWSLMMIVTFKYIFLLMRADNRGEGGIMALMALLPQHLILPKAGKVGVAALFVIAGAALLFGESVITPSLSVLSAVEGLKLISPELDHFVVGLTVLILLGLFSVQKKGTQKIGAWFGPIMLVWFATLGAMGLAHIWDAPSILKSLSPTYAIEFFQTHGFHGFKILGSVVLAVTGSEAIYADMGHFGRKPIQVAWLFLVFPCLILNYLGQGAFLIAHPELASNPFYGMVPQNLLYPVIILATAATVIASQALISGAYSLTSQAIRLGFFPRLTVKHTSESGEGQIYVPFVNTILAVSCIALVLIFRASNKLAAAYGLAVTGTMTITSIVFFLVTRHKWKWKPLYSYSLLAVFLFIDLHFLIANTLKLFDGGWIPLLIGVFFFFIMWIWKMGRSLLQRHFIENSPPLDEFLAHFNEKVKFRVPGIGVFMASNSTGVPPVVMRMVNRFQSLHQTVILLTVTSENVPFYCRSQSEEARVEAYELSQGFYRVIMRYGFMESHDIPGAMTIAFTKLGLKAEAKDLLFVLGHETFVERNAGEMSRYKQGLFSYLSRNARNATEYFGLPPHQVIELGTQIDL